MTDVHSKEVRSYNMSRIRSGNTKPEVVVRKFLFKNGLRFRLHRKDLPGKPDIVLPKYNTVIFVHGCFWHGHEGCRFAVIPKTRTDWWTAKIGKNADNDAKSIERLQEIGWHVIVVWECMLRSKKHDSILNALVAEIKKH